MKFSFTKTWALLLALPLVLASVPASAGPTSLAKVPLMSMADSGSVKPNLMLLYDDSGSMAFSHTPDHVVHNTSCRASSERTSKRACEVGDVPYNTSRFNRQYYNPALRYVTPVKADGTSYPSQTAAATSDWTKVTTDGFGIEFRDLLPAPTSGNPPVVKTTDLVGGFPDLKWCYTSNKVTYCASNVNGYTYPNNTYKTPVRLYGSPYYYTLNVNEYCENDTLKTCVTTGINAPAPNATYPVPAPLRYCTDATLSKCQAKYITGKGITAYTYPRFGDPDVIRNIYSTITINDSKSDSTGRIEQVYSVSNNLTQEITNGPITARGGTNTPAERAALARDLALSIIDKTGLGQPFLACIKTTSGRVPSCAGYGLTLDSDDMLAVVPVACRNNSTKTDCSVITSGERTLDRVVVVSSETVTGLMSFTGNARTTSKQNSTTTRLVDLRFGGSSFISGGLNLSSNLDSAGVVRAIVANIGDKGAIKAYVGGNSVSPQCAASNNATLCLIGPASALGNTPSLASINNNGTLNATAATAVSGHVPTSVAGVDDAVFTRTDIVASRDIYPRAAARTDCLGTSCTYAEEMTNFANWYAYYKSRNQMMKTSVGLAFQPLGENFKVGLVSLQLAAGQSNYTSDDDKIYFPKPFTAGARSTWYSALYKMNSNGGTPVRQALHEMGNMFANKGSFKQDAGAEVVEFACQQNFTFITTDGYWNGATASGVENNDNKVDPERFCTQELGCVDKSDQTLPSLADVALYWYNGGNNTTPAKGVASLRPDLEGELGEVRGGRNKRLHMRTYALGLGVDGFMKYEPEYDKNALTGGDLWSIINKVPKGCPWNDDGPYVWPNPETGETKLSDTIQSRVDDLWHAAINGGGKYFSASDPLQVVSGLNEALTSIAEATGAASSGATSTPNLSQADKNIFSSTFLTGRWSGSLTKKEINLVTGLVDAKVEWNSSWTVGTKVEPAADTRAIWYRDGDTGERIEFLASNLGPTEAAWFTNKCSVLSQCAKLTEAQRKIVNQPETIVGWLRGQYQYADDVVLRGYATERAQEANPKGSPQKIVLGDIASAAPAYMRGARKSYPAADYAAYRSAKADRVATVFVAANDGMLHAFDAAGGEELWAYMPRITMKKLHLQASVGYASAHQFTVDGTPELADVKIGEEWRTVLVGGLNGGGRGFYALDVTDPAQPKPLWEICADRTVCKGAHLQPELGFSYGNPQFGTIRNGKNADGSDKVSWVVLLTSGYNNIPGADGVDGGSGNGVLFVVDIATGEQVLNLGETGELLSTGAGSTATPSGLAKITAITANPSTDPLITYVYGGDNLGKMWRWDFSGASVKRILMGDAGTSQPITTRPDVAMCLTGPGAQGEDGSGRERVVVYGTGRLLDYIDIKDNAIQSVYVLKDSGVPGSSGDWRDSAAYAKRELTETRPPSDDKPLDRSDEFTIGGADVDLTRQQGWYLDLDRHTGERVSLNPKIVSGTLSIISNVPQTATACNVGGTSYAYQVNVCTGQQLKDIAGGKVDSKGPIVGDPPIVRKPDGELVQIGKDSLGNDVVLKIIEANSKDARRTGWRRVRD